MGIHDFPASSVDEMRGWVSHEHYGLHAATFVLFYVFVFLFFFFFLKGPKHYDFPKIQHWNKQLALTKLKSNCIEIIFRIVHIGSTALIEQFRFQSHKLMNVS